MINANISLVKLSVVTKSMDRDGETTGRLLDQGWSLGGDDGTHIPNPAAPARLKVRSSSWDVETETSPLRSPPMVIMNSG